MQEASRNAMPIQPIEPDNLPGDVCACGVVDCNACDTDDAEEIAVSFAIKATTIGSVVIVGMIVVLTFADCIIRGERWIPDDRILIAMVANSGALLTFFLRRKRKRP